MTMTNLEPVARDKCEYLLAEFRAAALRARLWQADIDAVGLALKAGLISPDQAVEHLSDCGLLRLLGLREEQEQQDELGGRKLAHSSTRLSRRPQTWSAPRE